MDHALTAATRIVDGWILAALVPLACYLAFSGVDDLFVDLAWLWMYARGRIRGRPAFPAAPLAEQPGAPQRSIAIFVPLWHEHAVIGLMLSHNIAAIRYREYAIFAGAYPNDEPTLEAVREMEDRFPNVHLAVCPHNGPTSKADCLNWIYQHMLLHEERTGQRFDLIVTHDAEDLVHPDALAWMNHYAGSYDFIQVPVLPLPTPPADFTHGVYCDEFAEFQMRDLPVRNALGGFVPSSGVGTAYSRRGLEALAAACSNRIFEPTALTEDYENGRRLHDLGFRQIFLPPQRSANGWVATREYFPRDRAAAIRQRTRWVTGIALQGWEQHGWSGGWKQIYWVWRDRKGLIGAPLNVLTNLITLYGLSTRMWDRVTAPEYVAVICWFTLLLQVLRSGVRISCGARVYGWLFASLAPARSVHANVINATAAARALYRYTRSKLRGEPLVWLKTAHSYPNRAALVQHRRRIGEILTGSGHLSEAELQRALASQPAGVRIGQHLVALGLLSETELYQALSVQQGLPLGAPAGVSRRAVRSLPAHVIRQCKVLPFRVAAGRLHVAASEIPTEALHSLLHGYTALEVRFHLVTPAQFERMQESAY